MIATIHGRVESFHRHMQSFFLVVFFLREYRNGRVGSCIWRVDVAPNQFLQTRLFQLKSKFVYRAPSNVLHFVDVVRLINRGANWEMSVLYHQLIFPVRSFFHLLFFFLSNLIITRKEHSVECGGMGKSGVTGLYLSIEVYLSIFLRMILTDFWQSFFVNFALNPRRLF
jgi:hypothetical protein